MYADSRALQQATFKRELCVQETLGQEFNSSEKNEIFICFREFLGALFQLGFSRRHAKAAAVRQGQ
jgi:hypothetical protein